MKTKEPVRLADGPEVPISSIDRSIDVLARRRSRIKRNMRMGPKLEKMYMSGLALQVERTRKLVLTESLCMSLPKRKVTSIVQIKL